VAQARLSALGASVIAIWLAATLPSAPGSGPVSLIGWLGAGVLVLGMAVGYRGAVAGAAVSFVVRVALMSSFDVPMSPPLWAHTLLIVLMVELAGASFLFRTRPVDPLLVLNRALTASVLAAALVQALAVLAQGAAATGVLVRAAGIAAVVIGAGWVTRIWRRSGLPG
jgi:hypothetical protein